MLIDQLLRLYEADGQPNPLPPVERTYQQFVRWQRELLAARGEELRRAWADDLAGAPLVLNLTPDKSVAYGEVFRVLKPGGRFLYADIIVGNELSESVRRDIDLWTG